MAHIKESLHVHEDFVEHTKNDQEIICSVNIWHIAYLPIKYNK